MQLSTNFTLAEMTKSDTATRKGIDNTPTQAQLANLKLLCEKVLEPVRQHYKKPVKVTSGFRCVKLNKAIGGSGTSQHCEGMAADFTVVGVSNLEVCQWIQTNLKFDQLIYEFGESGWAHCSYDTTPRQEVISAKKIGGKTKYLPGLVR